jgi:hypothetical protein
MDSVWIEDIAYRTIQYFFDSSIEWVHPAKSYATAICYARWYSEQDGQPPELHLDSPHLLGRIDPYFVRYCDDPATYHRILQLLGGWSFDDTIGRVPEIRLSFRK